jgi:uncharacterized protein YutE (UPF0331/DUF86 family)
MTINGIISSKLEEMDRVLNELDSVGELSTDRLKEDWRTKRAVERDLQIAVEIVIDICQRILSISGYQVASTSAEAIEQCQDLGIIEPNPDYRIMVQFRNFVVHRYESVDNSILCDIVNKHLEDIKKFKKEIQKYVRGN